MQGVTLYKKNDLFFTIFQNFSLLVLTCCNLNSLILLRIELYNSNSTLAADFDAQNTNMKKDIVRSDITLMIIAQKLEQIHAFEFVSRT